MPVFAIDTSVDTGKSKKTEREKSLQQKKTTEQDKAVEIKLNIDSVFLPILTDIEKKDKAFKKCSILSHPKLPADFGITSAVGEGVYDTIKGQILEQQAKSNALAPDEIMRYRNCMALYGAVVAQSHVNLMEMLGAGSIGLEDLQALAKIAVEKTLRHGFTGNVKKLTDLAVRDKTPCRFNQSLDHYKCGITTVDLSSQKLYIGDLEFYGEKFAGYVGEYKVSQSSKHAKEQVLAQKQAWEKSKSGKQAVSPSKLIPGL